MKHSTLCFSTDETLHLTLDILHENQEHNIIITFLMLLAQLHNIRYLNKKQHPFLHFVFIFYDQRTVNFLFKCAENKK